MSLKLYFHPLSSFCQKVLVALYENATPFEPIIVDLGDATDSANFRKIWPIGRFPVLRDDALGHTIPESSVIIEYLGQHYPGRSRLVPADADLAWQARLRDRFYDLYVNVNVGKIVTDKLRPAGQNDSFGVEQAKAQIEIAYGIIEREMATRRWATGDTFTLADCAAAPAMFYANMVAPLGPSRKNAAAYLERLMQRPSYARAVKEAQPYFALMPK